MISVNDILNIIKNNSVVTATDIQKVTEKLKFVFENNDFSAQLSEADIGTISFAIYCGINLKQSEFIKIDDALDALDALRNLNEV